MIYEGKSPLELTKKELKDYVAKLEKEMKQAAADLQFERAAQLRDMVFEYKAHTVVPVMADEKGLRHYGSGHFRSI